MKKKTIPDKLGMILALVLPAIVATLRLFAIVTFIS